MAWMDLRVPPFDIIRYTTSGQLMQFGRKASISATVMFACRGNGIVFEGAVSLKLALVEYRLRGDSAILGGWVGGKRRITKAVVSRDKYACRLDHIPK